MGPLGFTCWACVVSSSKGLNWSPLDRARIVSEEEGIVAAVLSAAAELSGWQAQGGHTEQWLGVYV